MMVIHYIYILFFRKVLQTLVYLLVDKLFNARPQLVYLAVDYAFNDLFLLEEVFEVVEGEPCGFFLLFSLVHLQYRWISVYDFRVQSYDKSARRMLLKSSNLPAFGCYFLPKCRKAGLKACFSVSYTAKMR